MGVQLKLLRLLSEFGIRIMASGMVMVPHHQNFSAHMTVPHVHVITMRCLFRSILLFQLFLWLSKESCAIITRSPPTTRLSVVFCLQRTPVPTLHPIASVTSASDQAILPETVPFSHARATVLPEPLAELATNPQAAATRAIAKVTSPGPVGPLMALSVEDVTAL